MTSPTFVLARTHPSLVGGAPLVHVDAYRLAGPAELDDLDLDFEGSVVIAEWGAGVVEERGSWIEIVIERPTGAGRDGVNPREAVNAADTGDDTDTIDNGHDDGLDELIEPRTVTITGYGPKYENGLPL